MSDSGELAHRAHALIQRGSIGPEDLDELVGIAMRDGVVDEEERAVLREVIALINLDEMDLAMLARLDALRDQFGV
jgi:uncharacterized membrane protein YebE (DUF533 family)